MKIEQDLHVHTYLSNCGEESATIPYYRQLAHDHGLKTIGITDHMWDAEIPFTEHMIKHRHSLWYQPQNLSHVLEIRKDFLPDPDVKFLSGAEVEYCPGRGPAITIEAARRLDFIIVPISHTSITMPDEHYDPPRDCIDFMVNAFMEVCRSELAPYITAIAHPFEPLCPREMRKPIMSKIAAEQYRMCFYAARDAGIAMEINTDSFDVDTADAIASDEVIRMLRIARDCGTKFTFGSDAHAAGEHDKFFIRAPIIADLLDLKESDIAAPRLCSNIHER